MRRFSIALLGLLAACSSEAPVETAEVCQIIEMALPDFHQGGADPALQIYVERRIVDRGDLPSLVELAEADFELWDWRPNCDPSDQEACLTLTRQDKLHLPDWSRNRVMNGIASLDGCSDVGLGPRITDRDWSDLAGSESQKNVTPVSLYSIDRIILSNRNNDRAIVTMQYICGGLCGEGYSLLLERQETGWVVIGKQPHWIS